MIQPVIDERMTARFGQLLDQSADIVLTCHVSPDGDAIGSSLGLCHVLRRMGKNAIVVTPDMPPRSLAFLPDVKSTVAFTQHPERAKQCLAGAQLLICLDFNTLQRIDQLEHWIRASQATRVMIDHHINPAPEFELMFSFPEMSSTCEVVFRVLMQMRLLHLIDRRSAQCLLTGMMTDTGNFAYNCENPEIYEIQASLMRRHVDRQWIYNMAMNTFSADCLRLQGYALDRKMRIYTEHGAALITLDADELRRYNYKRGDTEGLVNKPLSIPEVHWSVFMRQDTEYIKVSMRSQGDFSVNDFCARYFNGGGHVNAAGGEFYGTLQQAVEAFEQVLNEVATIQDDNTKANTD